MLQRAYDAGERDLRLLASLGLCELDAGNAAVAREFLERSVAGGVVRPRAAYELARLRWGDLVRGQPATRQFTADEIAPVIEPLRVGFDQEPAIAELIELWADACARTSAPPKAEDVQRLVRGAQLFIAVPRVCLRVARALGRHGKTTEAIDVLGAGFLHVGDDTIRAQFTQMFAALKAAPKK